MSNIPIISVENVSKKYSKSLRSSLWYGVKDIAGEVFVSQPESKKESLRKDEFWSLHNISFELLKGQSLAIIGDNGAGKSTLLKLIYGLIRPDTGRIVLRGKVGAMIELSAGLDPVLTGRENIYLKATLLGYSKKHIESLIDEIIEFAGIEDFIDVPIQFYSSGMSSRLAFSVTAHLKPDILLVDEALAVGDIDFQRKCINFMLDYLSSGGAIILVSHSPYHIQSVCNQGILIEQGKIVYKSDAIKTLDKYFNQKNQNYNYELQNNSSQQLGVVENSPIKIKEVKLIPLQNEIIATETDVKLQIKYDARENIESLAWGFSIWTNDNLTCITGNYSPNSCKIKQGSGFFECVIPKIKLTAGNYLLKTAIIELPSVQALALSGWLDAPLQFSVSSDLNIWTNY